MIIGPAEAGPYETVYARDSLRACGFARGLARTSGRRSRTTAAADGRAARGRHRVAAGLEQFHRLFERHRLGIDTFWNGRIGGAIGHVRTVPAGEQLDRRAVIGQLLQRLLLRDLPAT